MTTFSPLIAIGDLRDRQVVVDFDRPNPVVLASLTRRLNRHGIHQIVRATNQRGGELEMAAQVFNRHLIPLMSYAPDSFIGRIFTPAEFKLIPIDERTWRRWKSRWPGYPIACSGDSPKSNLSWSRSRTA